MKLLVAIITILCLFLLLGDLEIGLLEKFDIAFERVVAAEGEYANDKEDPGGETRYGISQKSFPTIAIKTLTKEQAKEIYREHYWDKIGLGLVDNGAIAIEILDTAINCGTGTAVRIAQRALNFLGEKLKVDGILGPVTLGAINKWSEKDAEALFKALNGYQFAYYRRLSLVSPKLKRFTRGWMKRIQEYRSVV